MSFAAAGDRLDDALPAKHQPLPRPELLQLYELAVSEYRFNVQLGAHRQTVYVALSVVATLAAHVVQLALAYAVGLVVSLAGAFIVHRSHRHYVAARQHFRRLERELGFDVRELGLSTTPGMQSASGGLSITRVAVAALLLLGVLNVAGAVLALWAER